MMKKQITLFLLLAVFLFAAPAIQGTPAAPPAKGSLKIITPNGGETIKAGSTYQIRWTTDTPKEKIILVLYKKGIKHSLIAKQAPNKGTFTWRVPANLPTDKSYRVRIRLRNNLAVNDFSDRDFTIKK